MMTFDEFCKEHPNTPMEPVDPRSEALRVYSQHPDLWHLSDFRVSSTVSGPGVILVRRGTRTKAETEFLNMAWQLMENNESLSAIAALLRRYDKLEQEHTAAFRIISALNNWMRVVGSMPESSSLMPDSETETFEDAIKACMNASPAKNTA